ncbi:MAG: hypothetical protein MZV64_10770 [Ignavibacteriales bacterium]|nr:hypothetical protein [Ignavibacteriales bacterium]
MVQLKARLDATRNTLQGEIRKAVDSAEAEYRAALKKETSLQRAPRRAARRRHPDEQERHLLPHPEDRGREHADPPQHPGGQAERDPGLEPARRPPDEQHQGRRPRPRAGLALLAERRAEPPHGPPLRALRRARPGLPGRAPRQHRQRPRGRREARRPAFARRHPVPIGRRGPEETGPRRRLPLLRDGRATSPAMPPPRSGRSSSSTTSTPSSRSPRTTGPSGPRSSSPTPTPRRGPSASPAPCPRKARRRPSPTWPCRSPSSRARSCSSTPTCASRASTRSST